MVALVSLSATAVGCSRQPTVVVDAGEFDVAVLGDLQIDVRPGQTVTLQHAGASSADAASPITHAFVGPEGVLPPLFAPQAGGLVPAPAVWGPCHGGDPKAIAGACPVTTSEGPEAWDGRTYWATGAMAPAETSEISLADDIAEGDHILTCALHPGLRVVLRVGGQGSKAPPPDATAVVESARGAVEDEAEGSDVTVTAGLTLSGAYVARFSPETVRIPVGGTVTWRAGGRAPVDVVFGAELGPAGDNPLSLADTVPPDGNPAGSATAWDGSGELRSGFLSADPSAGATAQAWTVTFTRPGTYTYVSRFGDEMIGMVIVEETGS